MLIAVLGRQPELSIAELEAVFVKIKPIDDQICLIDTQQADIDHLGGVVKLATFDFEFEANDPQQVIKKVVNFYQDKIPADLGKITLGVSWFNQDNPRLVQKIGLKLKQIVKKRKISLRLIPNQENVLSTATSFHNKLTSDKKIEIIIHQQANKILVGRSIGVQNINNYVKRDRHRPKRDARIGMLPPKLAQIMINLTRRPQSHLLDPFCGTGVVLQEAHLLGYKIQGSDKETRMIDFTRQNLNWLNPDLQAVLAVGDAVNHQWQKPIETIASEIYLGRPFSHIPDQAILQVEIDKINQLLTDFLINLRSQLSNQATLTLAVPAWLDKNGQYLDLPLITNNQLGHLGYRYATFKHIDPQKLLYHRPEQIVARRLLVLDLLRDLE